LFIGALPIGPSVEVFCTIAVRNPSVEGFRRFIVSSGSGGVSVSPSRAKLSVSSVGFAEHGGFGDLAESLRPRQQSQFA
jgi:hypothetical protein